MDGSTMGAASTAELSDLPVEGDGLSDLARRHRREQTSPVIQYQPRPDALWQEWRCEQAGAYGVWIATDEMHDALKYLRWANQEYKVFPAMMWDRILLHPWVLPTKHKSALITVLIDAHWVGIEARRKQGVWHLSWIGASREQRLRLSEAISEVLDGCDGQTVQKVVEVFMPPHLCGASILHRWMQLLNVPLLPVQDFNQKAATLCPAFADAVCSSHEAFARHLGEVTQDEVLARTARAVRQRFLLTLDTRKPEWLVQVGGMEGCQPPQIGLGNSRSTKLRTNLLWRWNERGSEGTTQRVQWAAIRNAQGFSSSFSHWLRAVGEHRPAILPRQGEKQREPADTPGSEFLATMKLHRQLVFVSS